MGASGWCGAILDWGEGGGHTDGCLIAGRQHQQGTTQKNGGTEPTQGGGRGSVIAEVTAVTRGPCHLWLDVFGSDTDAA